MALIVFIIHSCHRACISMLRTIVLLPPLLSLAVSSGCAADVWTRQEVEAWYGEYAAGGPGYGPLHYRGTDAGHHHFIIRALDEWVVMQVPVDGLQLEDERPLARYSGEDYPGYYAVDPQNGFTRIND